MSTGAALQTATAHETPQDITLFSSGFCPFSQRVWTASEYLGIPYKYYEIDPYQTPKPADLLEVSPKGLVPGLKLHKYSPPKGLNESTVILEYLEDVASHTTKRSLLPSDPYAHALIRLQADHVGRAIVPAFFRYLQAQEPAAQAAGEQEFRTGLDVLVTLFERAEQEVLSFNDTPEARKGLGLWVEGGDLGLVDVLVAPWIFRATNVLKHYRGFTMPTGDKFTAWADRLLNHPAFKATCSDEPLYIKFYERYAYNLPDTSQIANAINSGRALP
jgi:glutathione S-transferase